MVSIQLTRVEKLELYRQMVLLRVFEEQAAHQYAQGNISGFAHLYIGQEAVAVGAISALCDSDYVITAYREHGQAIAKGIPPREVMAELYGKATGCSRGRGGSMHMFDMEKRFMGGFAIVAGQMPIAVGLGFSIVYRNLDNVVLCIFGDGAVNEGAFHESLNLAKLWNLPVIFLCENNRYGMGTAVERAASLTDIAAHACAYGMPGFQANGMDVLEVRQQMEDAVKHARQGKGPVLVEALTYRFRGHSMADPLKYRMPQEEEIWQARDPIATFGKKLFDEGVSQEEINAIHEAVNHEVQSAVSFAAESPEPAVESLMDYVYAAPPPALEKARRG